MNGRQPAAMRIAKILGRILGMLRAVPHLVVYLVSLPLVGRGRAFSAASERVGKIPGFLGVYTRWAFYRLTLKHVGRDVHFGYMSLLSKPQASIGDRVYIGRFCTIGWARIEEDVMLADGVQILSGGRQHGRGLQVLEGGREIPMREQAQEFHEIRIGKGAWIGAGAVVMADVGEHALVAAGAVVTRPVPARARVGGVPAKTLTEGN